MTANQTFDPTDAALLELLQGSFPLVARPFDALGETLGIDASEVTSRISRLKERSVIRQISAIFDSAALGYSSELVAFRTEAASLDDVAASVCANKGVSHCYSRDAEYNLWFTITCGPDSDLNAEVKALSQVPGVLDFARLPQKRLFKIGVLLGVTGENRPKLDFASQNRSKIARKTEPLDPKFRPFVRVLQRDLPISRNPFSDLATPEGMTEHELLSAAEELLRAGTMRRYAAVLRHVAAGFTTNAMICWSAEPESIEHAGVKLAEHPAVSHCYEREVTSEWLWPLYTMVHCRNESKLHQVLSELKTASALTEYRVLRTVREYKKSRVIYFE